MCLKYVMLFEKETVMMKKLLTFLFVIGLPCFAIGAAATNTPTATNTPKPGVPGSSLASLQQTQIALQRAIATMGTSGNTTIYAQATIIANQLALAQAVATRDANGITGNVNAIVYGGKNVEVGTSTPGPIALDEKGRVIISVPSPTQTYTPTKTPTVDVSMTPMAGNQYTPTCTPSPTPAVAVNNWPWSFYPYSSAVTSINYSVAVSVTGAVTLATAVTLVYQDLDLNLFNHSATGVSISLAEGATIRVLPYLPPGGCFSHYYKALQTNVPWILNLGAAVTAVTGSGRTDCRP
jgi:hypothetical protein